MRSSANSLNINILHPYMTTTQKKTRKMSIVEEADTERNDYHLNIEERIWIIAMRLDCHSIDKIIQDWPFTRNPPSHGAIYELIKKVKFTGSVEDKPGKGGVITVDTLENRAVIVNYVDR